MRKPAAILLAAGAAVLAGCARSAPPAAPAAAASVRTGAQCFLASQANSFTPLDQTTVDVRVGANRYYRLHLAGPCINVDWARQVAIRTTGGSSWICQGLDAELIVPVQGLGPQRCLVTDIRPLTEHEAMAARRR